jgi:hypothetical protein
MIYHPDANPVVIVDDEYVLLSEFKKELRIMGFEAEYVNVTGLLDTRDVFLVSKMTRIESECQRVVEGEVIKC